MPHAPINNIANLVGTWLKYEFYAGVWWLIGSGSGAVASSRYTRPTSTSNPKGPNGREDAPWSAKGGRSEARSVEIIQQGHPGDVVHRYSGEASVPILGSSLGDIPQPDPSLSGAAMRECLAQFTERSTQLNAAAKELGSTFRMVGDAATGMAEGLDALMNKEWKRIGRIASWKKLPSAYLEYLYGWSPVSDDISNAFDSILQLADDGFDFWLTLRKKKTAESELVVERDIFDGLIPTELRFSVKQESRAKMSFQLPSWYFDQLPTVSPFGTLYETTRASFIVDWFIPIGDWIGAFESAQLWPFFRGGTVSEKLERRLLSYRVTNKYDYNEITQGPIRSSSYDYSYSRSVIDEMAEGIILARPTWRNPLSLSHAAQGLSLLTQVFNKWQ